MDQFGRVNYNSTMNTDTLKHAQRERLIFLDKRLVWRGRANRRDIVDRFGVSVPQAALDFKTYLALTGEAGPAYDPELKSYIAGQRFRPLFPEDSLEDWNSNVKDLLEERFDALPSLSRACDAEVVARVARAMSSGQSIRIRYTSMTSGDSKDQWITPTRFASDGSRTHVRAYSERHGEFRDYLPVRIDPDSSFRTRPAPSSMPIDHDWRTIARIELAPSARLSAEQAAAVRREYGFTSETLIVETRKALEFYADRRWGLDRPDARLERRSTTYLESPDANMQQAGDTISV
jgi:hypothetical protein